MVELGGMFGMAGFMMAKLKPLALAQETCLRAILLASASEQVGAQGIATCFQPFVPTSGSFRRF